MFFSTLSLFIILAVVGLIPVFMVRPQLETAADTLRYSFPRAFLLGLAAEFLLLPGLVVLALALLTIPLIPLYVAAAGLALQIGRTHV